MRSMKRVVGGTLIGLLTLWIGWGIYASRTTERIAFETLDRFDGIELRRYPQMVLVETTAADSGTAFRRLFRYITGANEGSKTVAMTAPVATRGENLAMTAPVRTRHEGGDSVSMTTPVRTDRDEEAVTMAFYLPSEYTPENAPSPTDPDVRLIVESPRTTAVRRFSWYATDERVDRERQRLLGTIAEYGIEAREDPVLLQYNDPWTPPFLRTNEIEVAVEERSKKQLG